MGQRIEELGERMRAFLFDRHRVKVWVSGLILISLAMGWISPQTAAVLEQINERVGAIETSVDTIDTRTQGVSDVVARQASAEIIGDGDALARARERAAILEAALTDADDTIEGLEWQLREERGARDAAVNQAVIEAEERMRNSYADQICHDSNEWRAALDDAERMCALVGYDG